MIQKHLIFEMIRFGPGTEFPDGLLYAIGQTCWCQELIAASDKGVLVWSVKTQSADYEPWHIECFLRHLFGSIAHQTEKCSCYGGTEPDEPPGLTLRQAAHARQ